MSKPKYQKVPQDELLVSEMVAYAERNLCCIKHLAQWVVNFTSEKCFEMRFCQSKANDKP